MFEFMNKYNCSLDDMQRWSTMYSNHQYDELGFDDRFTEVANSYYKSLDNTNESYDDVETEMFRELIECLDDNEKKFMIHRASFN